MKRSDRQRGTDSHCWYDEFINTATKIYFRATTTFTFGPDGVVFWSVKKAGLVHKKYDIPIAYSYKTVHDWCVAVKTPGYMWTHTVKVFEDGPLWCLDVPCKQTFVDRCDVPSTGNHIIPETFIKVGLEFGHHRGHGHRDFLHHYVHMVDFYVPVCGRTDTPEKAVARFARVYAESWSENFNIWSFDLE